MKLLLLAFAIISFLAQTTKGGWGEKKCFNKVGTCRGKCKSNEKEHSTCDNKKKCCVPSDKMPTEAPGTGTSKAMSSTPVKAGALTHGASPAPAGPGVPARPEAPAGPEAPGADVLATTSAAAPQEAATGDATPPATTLAAAEGEVEVVADPPAGEGAESREE